MSLAEKPQQRSPIQTLHTRGSANRSSSCKACPVVLTPPFINADPLLSLLAQTYPPFLVPPLLKPPPPFLPSAWLSLHSLNSCALRIALSQLVFHYNRLLFSLLIAHVLFYSTAAGLWLHAFLCSLCPLLHSSSS